MPESVSVDRSGHAGQVGPPPENLPNAIGRQSEHVLEVDVLDRDEFHEGDPAGLAPWAWNFSGELQVRIEMEKLPFDVVGDENVPRRGISRDAER